MSAKTILHLTITEIRRSRWILLALLGVIFLFPQLELFIAVGALVAAHLALSDHWNRTTAPWRNRPVSKSEWWCSRLLLGLLFFAVPAAIQQGWVMHQTGLGPRVQWLASLEGAIVGFDTFFYSFAVASLALTWKGFVGNLLKAVLIFYGITIFGGLLLGDNFNTDSFFESQQLISPLLCFLGGFVGVAIILMLSRRFNQRWQQNGWLILTVIVSLLSLSGNLSEKEPTLPERIRFTHESADRSKGHRPVVKNRRADGLTETEFFTLIHVIESQSTWSKYVKVTPPVWPIGQFNAYERGSALFKAIPEDRVILQSGKIQKQPPTEANLLDLSEFRGVHGAVHECRELCVLPLREGAAMTIGTRRFRLENRGHPFGNEEGMRFSLYISEPILTLLPSPARPNIPEGHNRLDRWRLVADHPTLGESVPLAISSTEAELRRRSVLSNIDHSRLDFILYADETWKLLWPDSNPVESWLEDAVLRIYHDDYIGRFVEMNRL